MCGVVVFAGSRPCGDMVGYVDGAAVGVGCGGCFVAGAYMDAGVAFVGGGFVLGGVGGGGCGSFVAGLRSRSPARMTERKARATAKRQGRRGSCEA